MTLSSDNTVHVSRLALEQLAAGELAAARRAEVELHITGCDRCRDRVQAIHRDAAGFADKVDVAGAVAALRRAVENPAWYRRPRVLAIASLGLACAVLLVARPWHALDGAMEPDGRRKGGLGFEVIRRDLKGSVATVASGDRLRPGEAIRFRVAARETGFLVILGIDAARVVTPYAVSHAIEGASPVLLDGSIILDATLGPERIVAIVCDRPVATNELLVRAHAELMRVGGDPRRVRRVSDGCRESSIVIEKVP